MELIITTMTTIAMILILLIAIPSKLGGFRNLQIAQIYL